MAKIKWLVEFSVEESWVADGFNLTKERATTMIENDLAFSNPGEVTARIVSKPTDDVLAKLQGFETVKDFRRSNGIG